MYLRRYRNLCGKAHFSENNLGRDVPPFKLPGVSNNLISYESLCYWLRKSNDLFRNASDNLTKIPISCFIVCHATPAWRSLGFCYHASNFKQSDQMERSVIITHVCELCSSYFGTCAGYIEVAIVYSLQPPLNPFTSYNSKFDNIDV